MPFSSSERRLAENEALSRKYNEEVQKGIEETNELAKQHGQPQFTIDVNPDDPKLSFYCECADEKCKLRVKLTLHEYIKIHKNRKRFVVIPGHEVLEIEKIVRKTDEFLVVEKELHPPENPKRAHTTKPTDAA